MEKKISQEDLAKKLDVAFSTVNRWFNRRSQPSSIQRYYIRKMMGRNCYLQDAKT
ncbi:MAG TPA: helix-turn-helix transcriptional regulator [bacterium]|nr:helix-turn-helix transcriptional regulator [bacterium]